MVEDGDFRIVLARARDALKEHLFMPTKGTVPKLSPIRWWSRRLTRMTIGAGLIVLGVMALAAPVAVGTWSLQFLGLPMLAVGVADLYATA